MQINVLHVEDDDVDIMIVKRAFGRLNLPYPLHIARNGVDALSKLRGTDGFEKLNPTPQIILLDLNMPKMNGLEFLEELRKDPELRHISVFIFSTSNNENDLRQAHQLNVAGYIIKPVNLESFTETLNTLQNFWKVSLFPGM